MEDTFGMDALDSAELTSNSLEKVPEIFFSNDFRLDDPRVFNEVIGNKKILQETIDYNGEGEQKSVVDNNVLQERFFFIF
ncbi:component of the garp (golgi-associated retrograde protein) complex [Brettanomyces bruxellensis AWRI1499]|nr:component of the garp (golgi-associated retrograde protein) complex [Brettanomyces bruxellensis AWRI1499]